VDLKKIKFLHQIIVVLWKKVVIKCKKQQRRHLVFSYIVMVLNDIIV